MNRAQRRASAKNGKKRTKAGLSVFAVSSLVAGGVPMFATGAVGEPRVCDASNRIELAADALDPTCVEIVIVDDILFDSAEGPIVINHDVLIRGDATGRFIDADGYSQIFEINSMGEDYAGANEILDVEIKDLILKNGNGYLFDPDGAGPQGLVGTQSGGAITSYFTPASDDFPVDLVLNNVDFVDNYASDEGGAVYIQYGTVETKGGTSFDGNVADWEGGAIYVQLGDVNITGDTTFISNGYALGTLAGYQYVGTSTYRGGAIYVSEGDLNVTGTATFNSNAALNSFDEDQFNDPRGGAVFLRDGDFIVSAAGKTYFNNNGFVDDLGEDVTTYKTYQGGAVYIDAGDFLSQGLVQFVGNKSVDDGGALHVNRGDVSLSAASTFTSNVSDTEGGAIYVDEGDITISGSATFTGNIADYGGAIYLFEGSITISGTANFTSNAADDDGGAIYVDNGNVTISGTANFTSNAANDDGGAIYIQYGDLTISNSGDATFTSNSAGTGPAGQDNDGGAVYIYEGDISIAGTALFSLNTAEDDGGAINVRYYEDRTKGDITISGTVTFSNNNSGNRGGAIYAEEDVTITPTAVVTFTSNSADDGGAIYSVQDVTLSGRVTFTTNSAATYGGAIYVENDLDINGIITFTGNTAGEDGGAIYADDDSIDIFGNAQVRFIQNIATRGGAIFTADENIFIKDNSYVLFDRNQATGSGGAIFISGGDDLDILNYSRVLFSRNTAAFSGGAIDLRDFTATNDSVVEFSGNSVTNGDGGAAALRDLRTREQAVVEFSNNTSAQDGGAVSARETSIAGDSRVSFVSNTATNNGGAIFSEGNTVEISNAYFGGNRALTGDGGAIFTWENVEIQNTTFYNNQAALEGGAIFALGFGIGMDPLSESEVIFSTFLDNSATGGDGDTPGQSIYTSGIFKIFGNIFASTQSDLAHLGEGAFEELTPEFRDLGGNFSTSEADSTELTHATSKIVTFNKLAMDTLPSDDITYPNSTRIIAIAENSIAADGVDVDVLGESIAQLSLSEGGLTTFDQRGATRTGKYDAGAFEVGISTYRDVVVVAPKVVLPAAPKRIMVKADGRRALRVEWNKPTTSGTGKILRYEVYRNGKLVATLPANARSFRDTGLDASQSYTYRIVTVGSQGKSIKSLNSNSVFPRR